MQDIGCPVAVKACSAAIAHKTEQNLVFLDVKDEAGLHDACTAILSLPPARTSSWPG